MDSFDTIMQYCPFLKEIIEGKIQQEAQTRDAKINELENRLTEAQDTIDNLTATILKGGN